MVNAPSRRSMSRRDALGIAALLPALTFASPAFAARTPSATEGPYYPRPSMRFADTDNDLVKVGGQVRQASGDIIILRGRIFDRRGKPANGARVEIWQTDADGRYLHTSDPRNKGFDKSFQGFGRFVTGVDGTYTFRTIKPVPYPGRTPHIHVKVFHGSRTLTTQFYLADHPMNARDGLYRRMSKVQRKAVEMKLVDGRDGTETIVDIRL